MIQFEVFISLAENEEDFCIRSRPDPSFDQSICQAVRKEKKMVVRMVIARCTGGTFESAQSRGKSGSVLSQNFKVYLNRQSGRGSGGGRDGEGGAVK